MVIRLQIKGTYVTILYLLQIELQFNVILFNGNFNFPAQVKKKKEKKIAGNVAINLQNQAKLSKENLKMKLAKVEDLFRRSIP